MGRAIGVTTRPNGPDNKLSSATLASTTNTVPWAKFGFEGVLIIVSILMAFAIDSWWSDRQDAIAEQRLLVQLKTEFQSAMAQLDEKQAMHARARSSALHLLSYTGPEASTDQLDLDQTKEDLLYVIFNVTYDPPTGVLSGLISSGNLDLISSDELRGEIASWPARYQDLLEDEQAVLAISNDELDDQYDHYLAWRNISPWIDEAGPSQFTEDVDSLLRSRLFENTLSKKASRLAHLLRLYEDIREQINRSLGLVEAELRN